MLATDHNLDDALSWMLDTKAAAVLEAARALVSICQNPWAEFNIPPPHHSLQLTQPCLPFPP